MGVPTHAQVSQLHVQQAFLLPAAGRETLQQSALERMLAALLSTCLRRFCPALTCEVAFLAAFTLQLAISGPAWQVLTEVSDALCSSRAAQLRGSLLRPLRLFSATVFPYCQTGLDARALFQPPQGHRAVP